jgi:N-acetylglutamate synthase/N-acetylornithine aminotransferase
VNYSGGGRSPGRRGFSYRSLPLWLQWVLPFAVAGGLVLALVLFVNYETNSVPAIALVTNPNAVKEQNREDTILVRDQQAPHDAKLRAGASPTVALRAAVVGYLTRQISVGSMDGPVKHSSCRSAAGGTSGRLVFHCDVTASAQMVTYPFDGVVQPSTGVITYCQRVAPPVPSMNVPVSKRCT